jgi:hypothetical protein
MALGEHWETRELWAMLEGQERLEPRELWAVLEE